jgi:peptidoglycan/xylan/chitin deacetylase (PgdA/CDA1 family)
MKPGNPHDQCYIVNWKKAAPAPIGSKARILMRSVTLTTLATIAKLDQRNFLRAIYCHYVFDDQKDRFEEIITELKKIGTFVDTSTCLEMLMGEREIDGRYLHLSFDDGFRNIFTNAVPILKRHNIPAIFFVPTCLIGANWERTEEYCFRILMTGVTEMVHWDELKEMSALGFEIGSHTRTHARFSTISKDPAKMEGEIIGSKLDLEERLEKECKYISWPYGERRDADALSLRATKRAGYHACFSSIRGVIDPRSANRYSIPRHHFEVQSPLSHIKGFARGIWESKSEDYYSDL